MRICLHIVNMGFSCVQPSWWLVIGGIACTLWRLEICCWIIHCIINSHFYCSFFLCWTVWFCNHLLILAHIGQPALNFRAISWISIHEHFSWSFAVSLILLHLGWIVSTGVKLFERTKVLIFILISDDFELLLELLLHLLGNSQELSIHNSVV